MVAHYHDQVWNAAQIARSLGAGIGGMAAASKAKASEVAFAAGTALAFRTSQSTIFNKSINIASGSSGKVVCPLCLAVLVRGCYD